MLTSSAKAQASRHEHSQHAPFVRTSVPAAAGHEKVAIDRPLCHLFLKRREARASVQNPMLSHEQKRAGAFLREGLGPRISSRGQRAARAAPSTSRFCAQLPAFAQSLSAARPRPAVRPKQKLRRLAELAIVQSPDALRRAANACAFARDLCPRLRALASVCARSACSGSVFSCHEADMHRSAPQIRGFRVSDWRVAFSLVSKQRRRCRGVGQTVRRQRRDCLRTRS